MKLTDEEKDFLKRLLMTIKYVDLDECDPLIQEAFDNAQDIHFDHDCGNTHDMIEAFLATLCKDDK